MIAWPQLIYILSLLSGNILTIYKIHDVLAKLYDARAKWFDLGLALEMGYGTLEDIQSKNYDNSENLRRMLAYRLRTGEHLTWAKLCVCLRDPMVGRDDLAEKIEQGTQCLSS